MTAKEYPPMLNGKTPWEFACSWYTAGEISRAIAREKKRFGGLMIESHEGRRIPNDVYSEEFAEWLTEQYRLAMAKGIEIGQRSAAALLDSLADEPVKVEERLPCNCVWCGG